MMSVDEVKCQRMLQGMSKKDMPPDADTVLVLDEEFVPAAPTLTEINPNAATLSAGKPEERVDAVRQGTRNRPEIGDFIQQPWRRD